MRASAELGQEENVSREEGNRRMMQIGKLLAITGFARSRLICISVEAKRQRSLLGACRSNLAFLGTVVHCWPCDLGRWLYKGRVLTMNLPETSLEGSDNNF